MYLIQKTRNTILGWDYPKRPHRRVYDIVRMVRRVGSAFNTELHVDRGVDSNEEECPALETGLVFGLLAGGRGVGNVVSGPLSVVLVEKGWIEGSRKRGWGYGTEYGWLVLFTGATALLRGWSWGWWACRKQI